MTRASIKSGILVLGYMLLGCFAWHFQPPPARGQDLADLIHTCTELIKEGTASLEAKRWSRLVEVERRRLSECKPIMSAEDEASALSSLSIGLIELGQLEDALAISRRCARIEPDAAFCHVDMGESLMGLGRLDEAESAFRRAIESGGYDEVNAKAIGLAKTRLEEIQNVKAAADKAQAEANGPDKVAAVMYGTGFFVTTKGHFVTNEHVVHDCREVKVGGQWQADLLDSDPRSDLAVLKVEKEQAAKLNLRGPSNVRLGEDVYAFGFPLPGLLSSKGNLSVGIVSATSGIRDSKNVFQITASLQPGSSGGPVIDRSGAVVGVAVAKLNAIEIAGLTGDIPEGVNFAVSVVLLKSFLRQAAVEFSVSSQATPKSKLPELLQLSTFQIRCEK